VDAAAELGFYSLTEADDGLLLDRMFLDINQIGRGLGRVLWQYAVKTARDRGVRVRHQRRPERRLLLRGDGSQVVRSEADRGADLDGADVPLHHSPGSTSAGVAADAEAVAVIDILCGRLA